MKEDYIVLNKSYEDTDRDLRDASVWVEDKMNQTKKESIRKEELRSKERRSFRERIKELEESNKEEEQIAKETSCKDKTKVLAEIIELKEKRDKDKIDKRIREMRGIERDKK